MEISFVHFSKHTAPVWFRAYLALKREVFVQELGWKLPVSSCPFQVEEDPFDAYSQFVLAVGPNNSTIGVIRWTSLAIAFPHQNLLKDYLVSGKVELAKNKIATLNAMAVKAPFRGKQLVAYGCQNSTTVAKALMGEAAKEMQRQGIEAILLTATMGVPVIFFERLGFYLLDAPMDLPGSPAQVINMGLLLADYERFRQKSSLLLETCPQRTLARGEISTKNFFEHAHHNILRGQSIEAFSGNALSQAVPH